MSGDFKIYTHAEVRTMSKGREPELLADTISAATTMMFGLSQVGKGRVLAEMVLSGLRGEPWGGREWAKPLESVLIATTDFDGELELARFFDRAGIRWDEEDRIHYWPIEPYQDWSKVAPHVLAEKPSLFIVDNVSGALVNGSLNDDKDANRWLANLNPLRASGGVGGVPVLLLAHVSKASAENYRKGGEDAFGSMVWSRWARNKLRVVQTTVAERSEGLDVKVERRGRLDADSSVYLANTPAANGDRERLTVVDEEAAKAAADRARASRKRGGGATGRKSGAARDWAQPLVERILSEQPAWPGSWRKVGEQWKADGRSAETTRKVLAERLEHDGTTWLLRAA